MSDPVDIVKLVRELPSRARGQACIVLTHEYKGQKEWAAELARQTESQHIDLLDTIEKDDNLCNSVAQFSVKELFKYLKNNNQTPVLIVTGIEFLKATWSGQANAVEQFASQVEMWRHSPCLLLVLQYDKTLACRKFSRFPQYTFVVDQEETLAL